jgi:capsular polysaccharide biosynthesis protein
MPSDRRLRLVAVAAGLAVALLVTLLQGSTYRADVSIVLARRGQPPGSDPALARVADAAARLFHSRAVAGPVIANLHLDESPESLLDRVESEADHDSSLVRVRVQAPSRDEARRAAQEVAEVSTVLFNDRFGPGTVASIWEAPRAEEGRVTPKPVRNLALGALAGALLAELLLLRRRRRPLPAAGRPAHLPVRDPGAIAVPVPEQLRAAAPQAKTTAPGRFARPAVGEWTLGDVERLLADQGAAFPERAEELALYLDSFRGVAGADGRLPAGVGIVVEDVFADLISRSRTE